MRSRTASSVRITASVPSNGTSGDCFSPARRHAHHLGRLVPERMRVGRTPRTPAAVRPSRCRTNRSGWKKPRGNSTRPFVPVTDAVIGRVRHDRARQQRGRARLPAQQHARVQVHALGREQRVRLDPVRLAEQQLRERHRVDAEIEQRAAAERRIAQPVAGVERAREAEVGGHGADVADRAVGDELDELAHQGMAVHPHPLHQEHPALGGEVHELPGLRCVERERLLAQHRLSGRQAEPRGRPVRGVRCGDVHHIDVLVGGQRGPVAVRPGDAEAVGEGLRGRLAAGRHRHHLGIRHLLQISRERGGDAARRQYAPSHDSAHSIPA